MSAATSVCKALGPCSAPRRSASSPPYAGSLDKALPAPIGKRRGFQGSHRKRKRRMVGRKTFHPIYSLNFRCGASLSRQDARRRCRRHRPCSARGMPTLTADRPHALCRPARPVMSLQCSLSSGPASAAAGGFEPDKQNFARLDRGQSTGRRGCTRGRRLSGTGVGRVVRALILSRRAAPYRRDEGRGAGQNLVPSIRACGATQDEDLLHRQRPGHFSLSYFNAKTLRSPSHARAVMSTSSPAVEQPRFSTVRGWRNRERYCLHESFCSARSTRRELPA